MDDVAIIRNQANIGAPFSPQEMERMAKRRFQDPKAPAPWAWTMRVWRDEFVDGKLNQGLESLGSATNFEHFIETIYKTVVKPGLPWVNWRSLRTSHAPGSGWPAPT